MAFLVFLYVVYSLTATFLPPMAKGAQAGGAAFIKNFNLDFYKVYFLSHGPGYSNYSQALWPALWEKAIPFRF